MERKYRFICQDHWDEIVPEIEEGKLNGIALQPIAFNALLNHGEMKGNDIKSVDEAAPICCWLEERTLYSRNTKYEDDYQILLDTARTPLDEEPEPLWIDNEEDKNGS